MLVFFRFLAATLLLVAAIAAVYDATRTLAGGSGLVVTSVLEHWQTLAPSLLSTAEGAVKRATHPLVWTAGIGRLLSLPTWAVFATLGLLFAYAGRRRRRVNVFAN
jgi:hypothetical protein